MILRRKTSAGKVRYGVRVDRASRKQEWIGTFTTLGEAKKAEAQAQLTAPVDRITVNDYVEHWLEQYRERVKASSYDAAASALPKFASDWRGIPLSRVTRTEAEKWAKENRWRVPVVITVMNAAVEAELIDRNPFRGLSKKGEGRKRDTPLTVEEVDTLAAAAGRESPKLRALVLFLAYSAVRPGEAFALEWSDVDFDAMRVRIERRVYKGKLDLPKGNRPRRIALTPPARDALLPIKGGEGLVFTSKQGKRLSQSSFAWYWKSISAVHPHKVQPYHLKHFAGHYLFVIRGLPDRVVAAQFGHTDGGKLIRELYGHPDVGALEEIDAAFENVVPLRRMGNA
jgi:integrase